MTMDFDNVTNDFFGEYMYDNFDEEDYFRSVFDEMEYLDPNDFQEVLDPIPVNEPRVGNSDSPKVEEVNVQMIASNDVRRTYAKQLEKGINLHDVEQFQDILRGFSTDDLTYVATYPKGNPHGVVHREVHSVDVVADYLTHCFSSCPDNLFLIHDTQLVTTDDGCSFIICKFTSNGSRMYTITADHQGVRIPDPPTLQRLHESPSVSNMKGSKHNKSQALPFAAMVPAKRPNPFYAMSSTTSTSTSSQCVTSCDSTTNTAINTSNQALNALNMSKSTNPANNHVNALKQSIVFKGPINKYDRYKRQKVSTLGVFVDYRDFSETSLMKINHTKKKTPAEQVRSAEVAKQRIAHNNAVNVANGHSSNNSSYIPPESRMTGYYKEDDVMIAGEGTVFGLSAMLPAPVKFNIFGVAKLHLNENHKMHLLEFLCAFKNVA